MSEGANILRDDISGHTVTKSEALKNAPSKDSDYFKVPKFIEK
jgi:aspartyl-tRNA(Asn)/glutamyl-tRNA(Gln) amidotransferase subunit C